MFIFLQVLIGCSHFCAVLILAAFQPSALKFSFGTSTSSLILLCPFLMFIQVLIGCDMPKLHLTGTKANEFMKPLTKYFQVNTQAKESTQEIESAIEKAAA